jgi:aldose 1-epimerase
MKVTTIPFDEFDGKTVNKYVLETQSGIIFSLMNYGATILDVSMPDKKGNSASIITGFDDLAGYRNNPFYFGATIGRFGNRIAKATFTLEGKKYDLEANNGPNNLHGGPVGFDSVYWEGKTFEKEGKGGVVFTYTSPDGECGFPGDLDLKVTYTATDAGELRIDYRAETNAPTPVNLTNHTYWNLAGVNEKSHILDHRFKINGSTFTPVDEVLIPTGEIKVVKGTPWDFTSFKTIGYDAPQGGYDHNWVIDGKGMREACTLIDDKSGRKLTILTDQPGMQVFTAFGVDAVKARGGLTHHAMAIALETQNFPNCVNEPDFPDCILKPGDIYQSTTVFKLEWI